MQLRPAIVLVISLLWLSFANAQHAPRASQAPLLVIGASYSEGRTPFKDGNAPFGGISVGFGSYLSLGQALTRLEELPGFVINEAQAGAGTFARPFCAPGAATCGPAGWDSYQTQLERGLARVALPPMFTQYSARYVVITTSNDCLHADAFGIPQAQSQPCTYAQMNATVDRLIALGNFALSKGVVPIYDMYPRYQDLDLVLFRTLFGLAWVINESDYEVLRMLSASRIRSELPRALLLDMWKDFRHLGDGIHPDYATVRKAAQTIATELLKRDGAAPR
jgi:hypothetical protein